MELVKYKDPRYYLLITIMTVPISIVLHNGIIAAIGVFTGFVPSTVVSVDNRSTVKDGVLSAAIIAFSLLMLIRIIFLLQKRDYFAFLIALAAFTIGLAISIRIGKITILFVGANFFLSQYYAWYFGKYFLPATLAVLIAPGLIAEKLPTRITFKEGYYIVDPAISRYRLALFQGKELVRRIPYNYGVKIGLDVYGFADFEYGTILREAFRYHGKWVLLGVTVDDEIPFCITRYDSRQKKYEVRVLHERKIKTTWVSHNTPVENAIFEAKMKGEAPISLPEGIIIYVNLFAHPRVEYLDIEVQFDIEHSKVTVFTDLRHHKITIPLEEWNSLASQMHADEIYEVIEL